MAALLDTPPEPSRGLDLGWTRGDQAAIAALTGLAMAAMAIYWVVSGGWRGDLIEVDRAERREAAFRVDINRAAWPELAQLPEIGETLAKRIVASREAQGPFARYDDLRRVSGIGPATLEQLRPFLLPIDAPDASDASSPSP